VDQRLTLPEHQLSTSVFRVKFATVPDPGVATEFNFSTPVNSRIQIIGVRFQLVTGLGGASRLVTLNISEGGTTIISAVAFNITAAGKTYFCNFNSGQGCGSGTPTMSHSGEPLPTDFYLNPGQVLSSLVKGLQLVDVISDITVRYKQWVSG